MKQAVIVDKITGEIVYRAQSKRDGWRILKEHTTELARTKRHSFYNVKMNTKSWYWVCWEDEAQSLDWVHAPTLFHMVLVTDTETGGKLLFLHSKHVYQYFNMVQKAFYRCVHTKIFYQGRYAFDYITTPEQVQWLRDNPNSFARVSGKEKIKEIYPFNKELIKP